MKPIELEDIILLLQKSIAEETKLKLSEIDIDQSMGTLGLDSINSVYLLQNLENFLQVELSPILFWDYPTIKSLSEHLYELKKAKNE